MTLSELQKKRDKLKSKLAKVEEKIKAADGLRLKVDCEGDLCFYYKENILGFISYQKGRCHILNSYVSVKAHEQWRADGMPINETPVKWKGMHDEGEYRLVKNSCISLQRIDLFAGYIYDFSDCESYQGCEDENIYRFKHNDRPVIF